MKKIWISFACLALVLMGCGSKDEEEANVEEEEVTETEQEEKVELTSLKQFPQAFEDDAPVAIINTTMGEIRIVLFPKEAPKAVENFTTHAKDGYYDGVTFHRVMNEFMIQGGDPQGTGMGGESIWNEGFENEISNELYHFNGALSMANTGQPNSNGSQFFIVQLHELRQAPDSSLPDLVKQKYEEIGGTNWLDGKHTVFGQVISGMDVVDAIAAVEVDANDKPVEPVTINSIVITTYKE